MERIDADVAIVGDGPVGQTLAVLLARQGWQVVVVDRWPQPYTMSRAVAFDSETARILAMAGIRDYVANDTEPSGRYIWRNGEGRVLLDIQGSVTGWCGWPDSTSMYQPALENALRNQGRELPSLRVRRGWEAVAATDLGDRVELRAVDRNGESLTVTAGWLVGCDGANSFVRGLIDPPVRDLGFSHDWLICDVVLTRPRVFDPNNLQVCDPARPRTEASAGPGHRRWEFMRVADESVAEIDTVESAWRLLELFDVTPDNARLLRHAVYTFQSRWAENLRSGRVLIAGDAAHVMPPFAGQGMCSGLRDAANLAWKLGLVLRGQARDGVLDSYVAERVRHVQHAVRLSVDLGKVICQLDPRAAADRDLVMTAARERGVGAGRPQAPVHPLRAGLLHHGGRPPAGPLTGTLSRQARVARRGVTGLFDEVVGSGFVLLSSEDPRPFLDADTRAFLAGLGTHLVTLVPAGEQTADGTAVVDVDDVYLPYLAAAGARAVLVRPDFYVFGQVTEAEDYGRLVTDLRRQIAVDALTTG
ncbi:bifunctional 3-(3-hydroxy-phenyl)propionate/3-hydroxycinnamic acid hydroxylase [Micromonospora cathayae]|uniref:Bifunctional 3-(3-hydroxy-phenyl)propionate/3-hydroxycinnamic acid hydroxylase n=1 Tax=Micromonospora cathayae TaxID=3028804 RepID=A0ABY7ZUG8_9ACTN|nr:bifunctional 3-(3-hydroxy-phenyl)propionate/3-hydroxycinnamic acid hydroxylase [Micromonospora sp. HUAS 3]WDZ86550.1 bifunctional 3-(3-hydroxy-phenyl)propionate/3-hydroxycinnamic acid hydroxylase [Micromonospora sp. HUAS 3]